MTLSNRFSALFLATVGVILAGFSTALLVSSRIYLDHRVDDRLAGMVALLKTCIDEKPGWVRWEARPKRLPPSRWGERHATTWLVADGTGSLLTRPADFRDEGQAELWARQISQVTLPDPVKDRNGRSWRVVRTRVDRRGGDEPGVARPDDTPDGKVYRDTILFAAFASIDETDETVASLGGFLLGISQLVWFLAALGARGLSRAMLVPLTNLVEAAQGLDPSNPGWTLAGAGTRDELDELRRAFNDLLARLHEAYDRQRRFTSEASHHLRTQVAVMIGHLEVAQRYDGTAEEYRRVIELAHRRASELGQLVEALLFLSRADSGTLVRSETLDLNSWLIQHTESRTEAQRLDDIIVDRRSESPIWVKANPHLLAQLLENLLDNASKYSLPGTPIRIATGLEPDFALLSVSDQGRGIGAEDLPRIFEPFFRSLAVGRDRVQGFGLGLSIARSASFRRSVGPSSHTVRSAQALGSRYVYPSRWWRTQIPPTQFQPICRRNPLLFPRRWLAIEPSR